MATNSYESYMPYPSQETVAYWTPAVCSQSWERIEKPSIGKFLVYKNIGKLDETWAKVVELMKTTEFSLSSKSSTARENPTTTSVEKVICIYTSDSEHKKEIAAIAWKLHEAQIFTGPVLNYKEDSATLAGLYARSSQGQPVSRYSIGINSFKVNKDLESFTTFFTSKYTERPRSIFD